MKKVFITSASFLILFFISIFTPIMAQEGLTLYQTRLCIMFKPGVISLPQGVNQAIIQDIPNLPNWLSSLSSAGLQEIAKANPNFNPADTIKILPNGKKIKKLNYTNIYRLIFNFGANLDSVLNYLKPRPEVVFVERWPIIELAVVPNDDSFPKQWALHNEITGADINAPEAWNYTTGSPSIKIGIMDSGIRGTHQDLLGKIENSGYWIDPHGTEVAGVAAAIGNNSKGIAGVDWNASIYSKIVYYPDSAQSDLAHDSIVDAVDVGLCQVLNYSWDVPDYNTEIRSAFAYAYKSNVVSVAAMGNTSDIDTLYPAAFQQGVIAVGATDDHDDRANYSTIGNHIDVVAPGGPEEDQLLERRILVLNSDSDTSYFRPGHGTSFSTPHVSGLASLLLGYYIAQNLSNDDIQNIIQLSAKDVNFLTDPGWDSLVGWGRIDAKAAFDSLQIPNTLDRGMVVMPPPPPYSWEPVETLDTITFIDTPCLTDGKYFNVVKWKATTYVTFPFGPYYMTPPANHVWGVGVNSEGYSQESPNFGMGFCEVVPGSITTTGCSLRTYVYEVAGASPPCTSNFVPTDPTLVSFGYTVLGERQLSVPLSFTVTPLAGPPNRIKSSWLDCNANEQGFKVLRLKGKHWEGPTSL